MISVSSERRAEKAEGANFGARVAANLRLESFVDLHAHAKISRRVVVDRQKLDRLDRPGELTGDEHRSSVAQPICVRQVGDQLVAPREQVCRLAEFVDRDAEHEQRGDDDAADFELVPRDER